ncbi:MAG: nucleotidyl transferase AbiEii/AbiGii toxin family protein [Bacilli bacterium]|nr:nucleotidyl transferase AbiEii/AbiGii toxin family protein [Bacilli bacterium]MBP3921301.1 nucleotidyl transferase AbiEii/AbiGii toxin family protein [Bacilli bacterium]
MVSSIHIKEKAKIIEKEHNLNHYEILQRYMFERILERISVSKYRDNFILKGGLLLSAMFGIDNRTTKDMDTTITGIDVSKEKMANVLNQILSINLNDGVKFDVVDITDIREEDEYGGNKYHIVGRRDNLKVNLEIDISTGDKVTPRELKYNYPLLFEDKTILINSYNIETILSEKMETILKRGKFNSRMKDFYDVYFFINNLKNEIDIDILKEAIENTFTKRNSFEYLNDYEEIILSIKGSDRIKKLWQTYSSKYKYANNISIEKILDLLLGFINELDIEVVAV